MIKVEALVNCPFGTGIQQKGAQFEATQAEANILVALKRVRIVTEKAKVETPAEKVEQVEKAVEPKAEPKKQKGYNRRDMRAKD